MQLPRRKFLQLTSVTGLALLHSRTASSLFGATATTAAADPLLAGFTRLPALAKPGCYWWWFNGLVSKAGITRDLEEFAAKGLGEVLMVNSSSGFAGAGMPLGVKLLSPEWWEFYRHALREAARLKIDVGVNLSSGWCMGGPWIEPRHAGRWFLQSRLTLTGPQKFSGKLPLPGGRDGYDKVFNPPGYKDYIDLPLEKLDYRDTAVVAFPEPATPGGKFTGARAALLSAKTNRKDASNFTRARDVMGPTLTPWTAAPGDTPIPPAQVVDLTAKVQPDGTLEWEVPPGNWIIVRTGHRMTGSRLMIAQPEADGLSIDWFAPEGLELQFKNLGEPMLAAAGDLAGTTLKYFCGDSFEDGFPNWTEKILERFAHYRGYDARPYLPVLAGYLVGSAEISDRFLHDYRKTVADCMADHHYRRFAELCHARGVAMQSEAAGPSRSGTICFDGLKNLGHCDRPMGEFWLGVRHTDPDGLNPKLGYGTTRLEDGQNKVTKMVASAAHIYGRTLAPAESFTTYRHWQDSPATLKPAADRAFCEGINRLVVHSTTATRPEDGLPGYEYGAGTHFNPNITWWQQSGPFLDYLGRCQFLLQQGLFVADVLYYNGDWAPNIVPPKHVDPALGAGYDYDVCNADVLLHRLSVRDGRIVLPDGMSYRLLVLPDTPRMPVEVAAKLRELVRAGATLVGPKPTQDPGLKNYPRCDDELRAIAAELWGACDGQQVTQQTFGRGRVFWGVTLREILQKDGVSPDFECAEAAPAPDFLHRTTATAEIYFVSNRAAHALRADATFRVADRRPEIWDPVSGERWTPREFRRAAGRTTVPLEFAPNQSLFVLFRTPEAAAAEPAPERNFLRLAAGQELTGAWTVKFDPQWGGPAEIEFAQLDDWITRPEEGIKHYSGKATYVKRFDCRDAGRGRLFLDLGKVKDIAEVRLNGRKLGIVWTAPWRVEITAAVRPTDNQLEIDVVNLWPNRLIGDAKLPAEQRRTRTNITLPATVSLLPSGLLGPVVIQSGEA
ncbi:MAG: glycosyl transferase family 2 [Opitutae bacterium]|nr:glycosyl transferase family 2 [Opitutae bacterium]